MNRRTLLTTLLSGLSAGVAAIAGRKKPELPEWQKGFPITSKNRVDAIADFTRGLSTRYVGVGDISFDMPLVEDGPKTWEIEIHGEAEEGQILYMNDQRGVPFDFIYRDGEWIRCYKRGGIVDNSLIIKTVNA